MAHSGDARREGGVLATLAKGLQRGAGSFAPEQPSTGVPNHGAGLPGRRRGEGLASVSHAASTPASAGEAVVLDCGISRRDSFTHVLWISPSATSLLGPDVAEVLGDAIGAHRAVHSWGWQGGDRLHVRAPGMDWDALLTFARETVDGLVG
ncbi:hypothetical protein [uncultured Demequina sp.]|uniref:hypothetical protein n=1 Tax=uncultured Demequina sp. TaxID=693499 RepID=UPI0025D2C4F4|nr:hypothetical protein [uncultured Demequina sp.]